MPWSAWMCLCGWLCVMILLYVLLGDRPPRSPGVDPKQLAAELQKVSQQQAPTSTSSSGLPATTSATSSPGQPGSPSVSKKRHSSKASSGGSVCHVQFRRRCSILQITVHPWSEISLWARSQHWTPGQIGFWLFMYLQFLFFVSLTCNIVNNLQRSFHLFRLHSLYPRT